MLSIYKPEQRSLVIDFGNDATGGDFVAASEHNASSHTALDANLRYAGAGTDFDSRFAACCGHSLRNRAHATLREPSRTACFSVTRGPQHQHHRAPRRPRPEVCPKDAAGGNCRPKQFSIKPFRDQVGDCHRSPSQQLIQLSAAESPSFLAGLEESPKIAGAGMVDIRRSNR